MARGTNQRLNDKKISLMKNGVKILMSLVVLLLTEFASDAQCTLSATSSGYNGSYIQVYVLVDQNGDIVAQNSTGIFNSVSTGVYHIHALNYDPSNPPAPLPVDLIGLPVSDVGSTISGCYNSDFLTDYVTQICSSCQQNLEFCDGESVVITSSGSAGGYTQLYVLVDTATDLIIATNSTGDFTGNVVAGGSYQVYALNYNPADVPSPLPTVGQNVSNTGSSYAGCYNVDFLTDYVCVSVVSPSSGTDVQAACDSFTWIDGNTYVTNNNTATWTLINAAGCDSVVTLDLTVNYSSTGTDVQVACESYTWIDGNTYTANNNSATWTLTNAVGCDSVVTLDLTINNPSAGTEIVTACNSYTWIDGNTYTSNNNTATWTLTNAVGCDSVVTLDLTITNSNTGTDVVTACNSYTWIDGVTYMASTNTPMWTLTNSSGCDSVVTLDLTISTVVTGTDVQTACDSYDWIDGNTYNASTNTPTYTYVGGSVNGCDSIVTLNLTINSGVYGTDVQTACDTYTWLDGNTYSTDNNTATYTYVGGAVNGCDSTVTLNLTITASPPAPNAGTDSTYCSDWILDDMLASGTGGTLAWYDAQNNLIGTGSSFTPLNSIGLTEYYVSETVSGCEGPLSVVNITIENCDPEQECGDLFIPTAFSPNNDDNNEVFRVLINPSCVDQYQLYVFDRWGELVFESDDPTESWDGTFRDKELETASYVYAAEIKLNTDTEPIKYSGSVLLIK